MADSINGSSPSLCHNFEAVGTEWQYRILELIEKNPHQLNADEYATIARCLIERGSCRFLVFGLGRDSAFWTSINSSGLTVFLEDDLRWLSSYESFTPNAKAYPINYGTRVHLWEKLLVQFIGGDSQCLHVDLPVEVESVNWDVIFVDAPTGYDPNQPGRMKSIAAAASLAKRNSNVDVFVHDCDRPVERTYCNYFFSQSSFVAEISKLRHYRC